MIVTVAVGHLPACGSGGENLKVRGRAILGRGVRCSLAPLDLATLAFVSDDGIRTGEFRAAAAPWLRICQQHMFPPKKAQFRGAE
jgi:hypothetical protein